MARKAPVRWPATFLRPAPEGTCYVPGAVLPRYIGAHGHRGMAWGYGGRIVTYWPRRDLMYKSMDRFDWTDIEDAWETMTEIEHAGFSPPSSYADVFEQAAGLRWGAQSRLAPFRGRVRGPWRAALVRGAIAARVRLYDLRSAYRWAACAGLGLPDARSLAPAEAPWDGPGLYLCRLPAGALPYAPWAGWHVVSHEEREVLSLAPIETLAGARIRSWVQLAPVFARLDREVPRCAKAVARAFWGRWLATEPTEQWSWGGGSHPDSPEVSRRDNPWHNPVAAHVVLSRVKLALVEAMRYLDGAVLHVDVDALLTTGTLPEGAHVGAFRLVEEYPRGVWIDYAGGWGEAGSPYYRKHAGRPGDRVRRRVA